jgi:hypothetical protein
MMKEGLHQRGPREESPPRSQQRSSLVDKIKRLDVYPKTEADFVEKTNAGAIGSSQQ